MLFCQGFLYRSIYNNPKTNHRRKTAKISENFKLARGAGIEPALKVLETLVLPLYEPRRIKSLLHLFMRCVLFAKLAMFFHFQLLFEFFLIPGREIIDVFARFAFHFD